VISRCCLSVEDDLVCLKQRLAESEASQKSLNRAVFELNKEKRDLLGAVEAVKVELLAKEGDVKAAVDACDEAVKEMKHLMGQMEGARVAADNNPQCFYFGFEAFWKQAKEKYPNIDFTEFQPYNDTDLVNDGGEKVNDSDKADDATS
jgi:predicted  nucleic acid-binding Zn-ribbon protein